MGLLTLVLLAIVIMAISAALMILKGREDDDNKLRDRFSNIKSVGLFALVIGIFAQLIGLYEGFSAIQEMGDISPAFLAEGFKVSMIANLYGIFIFLLTYVMWFGLVFLRMNVSPKKN